MSIRVYRRVPWNIKGNIDREIEGARYAHYIPRNSERRAKLNVQLQFNGEKESIELPGLAFVVGYTISDSDSHATNRIEDSFGGKIY